MLGNFQDFWQIIFYSFDQVKWTGVRENGITSQDLNMQLNIDEPTYDVI